jgi:hypothetical protein
MSCFQEDSGNMTNNLEASKYGFDTGLWVRKSGVKVFFQMTPTSVPSKNCFIQRGCASELIQINSTFSIEGGVSPYGSIQIFSVISTFGSISVYFNCHPVGKSSTACMSSLALVSIRSL